MRTAAIQMNAADEWKRKRGRGEEKEERRRRRRRASPLQVQQRAAGRSSTRRVARSQDAVASQASTRRRDPSGAPGRGGRRRRRSTERRVELSTRSPVTAPPWVPGRRRPRSHLSLLRAPGRARVRCPGGGVAPTAPARPSHGGGRSDALRRRADRAASPTLRRLVGDASATSATLRRRRRGENRAPRRAASPTRCGVPRYTALLGGSPKRGLQLRAAPEHRALCRPLAI
ncbi:unnamed protein product [Prorocentrum cordatum]|uniref:Uncharacterized protein n=1 Tax=Prorocentrum cordatum TaxID=2364126 RepID=A0ABN9PV49_9DINO|nr:unnamed protein product [Polarella glacialis]